MNISYHPKVKKDLKGLDKKVARDILMIHIPNFFKDSHRGISLTGELRNFCKFVFSIQGTAYRIIYTIETNPEEKVKIYYIGTRENAYARLLRRLR